MRYAVFRLFKCYNECHYGVIMLNVDILSGIVVSVIRLNVVMLSVVALKTDNVYGYTR